MIPSRALDFHPLTAAASAEGALNMQTRRQLLQRSAAVAGVLGGLGLLPPAAQAAWNAAAFEAKTMPELVKALGVSAPARRSRART